MSASRLADAEGAVASRFDEASDCLGHIPFNTFPTAFLCCLSFLQPHCSISAKGLCHILLYYTCVCSVLGVLRHLLSSSPPRSLSFPTSCLCVLYWTGAALCAPAVVATAPLSSCLFWVALGLSFCFADKHPRHTMGCGATGGDAAAEVTAPADNARKVRDQCCDGTGGRKGDCGKGCRHKRGSDKSGQSEANDLKDKLDIIVARLVFEEEQVLLYNQYIGGTASHRSSRSSGFLSAADSPTHHKRGSATFLSKFEIDSSSSLLKIETPTGECEDTSWSARLLEQECALCLEEFTTGDCLRLLFCSHAYHKHCIDSWFARSRLCPFCLQDATLIPKPRDIPLDDKDFKSPASPFIPPLLVDEDDTVLSGWVLG
eukprot:Rhum_TRINITY_DN13368_c0_g1::Rhum_TRINITY_DN13368_c0_g1_i1::g.59563::m.59563